MMFDNFGIPAAAGIINFVVLTAALSSCNSGIFSTGRMLFNLAQQGEASPRFAKLGKTGVPSSAIVASSLALLIGVLLNYIVPEKKVFMWVTSIATFGAIWTWVMILVAQIRFRKSLTPQERGRLTYKMPLAPAAGYICLAFLAFVVGIMAYFPDTRIALVIGPLFLILMAAVYYRKGFHIKKKQMNGQVEMN